MFENYDDILTSQQVMEILGISKNVLYELLSSGELVGFKIGRVHRIPRESLANYIVTKCRKNAKK